MWFRTAVFDSLYQSFPEYVRVKTLNRSQDVDVVEVTHSSVRDAASYDGLEFLCEDNLQVVRENTDYPVLEHQFKAIFNLPRCDKIAGSDVNFESLTRPVKDSRN